MTKIFVPQPIPDVAIARLREIAEVTLFDRLDRQISEDELVEAVTEQNILYALGEIDYTQRVIDAAPDLELIAAMHMTAKFVDIPYASTKQIPVCGLPKTGVGKTTAEFTFALLMATAWRLPEADAFLRADKWHQNQSTAFMGSRLYGKTLGIVGMGLIGQGVARRAVACDMNIIYNKRVPLSPAEEAVYGGAEHRSLEDLFMESDIIAITPALTHATKGLISEDLISLMKPTAILINTSRGPIVDEEALERALRAGRIRGAGLDVYWTEVPEANPGPIAGLKDLPNVVLTPHMGSAARETRDEMAMRTVQNIERFLDGKRPFNVLNPEVYGETAIVDEVIG